jgi:hypothetical protein
MELGVGGIDLEEGEGVRDLLGRRAHPGHAIGHAEERRDRRAMRSAQTVEQDGGEDAFVEAWRGRGLTPPRL